MGSKVPPRTPIGAVRVKSGVLRRTRMKDEG
jgi:hypothetical protein